VNDAFEAFRARYADLAVVTCEWRACGVEDPEALAGRVWDALRVARRPLGLKEFYRVVEDVVDKAYRRQAESVSMVESIMTGSLSMLRRGAAGSLDAGRKALAGLGGRDADLLRWTFWDGLSPAEIAEVAGRDASHQERRLTEALRAFGTRLPRELADDPAAAMRELQPGTHRRGRPTGPEA